MGLDCCCLILAAGKGTRLLPLTKYVPKPLFPILNRPALGLLLNKLTKERIARIAVNCHHLGNQIKTWLQQTKAEGVVTLLEESVLLDTGGAIKNCFEKTGWQAPLLVYNADVVSNLSIEKFYNKFLLSHDAKAMFCLHDEPRFNKVKCHNNGLIGSFNSKDKGSLAYTGISIFRPECFHNAPNGPFSLIPFIENLIQKGTKIAGCRGEKLTTNGNKWQWHDIGTPKGYLEANFSQLSQLNQKIFIETSYFGENVTVRKNVIIGRDSFVDGDLELEDVVIWPKTKVQMNGQIRNTIFTPFGNLSSQEYL